MFSQSIFNNWTIAEISKNETALVYIFLKRRYIASWKFYWAKVSLKKCECNSWRHLIYRSEFRWFLKNSIRTIEEFQCHLQNSNWKSFKTTAFGVFSTFLVRNMQSYEIKSPPWTILWFRILGIFSVENIERLCVFMFQTWDNSQLCTDSQYSSQ